MCRASIDNMRNNNKKKKKRNVRRQNTSKWSAEIARLLRHRMIEDKRWISLGRLKRLKRGREREKEKKQDKSCNAPRTHGANHLSIMRRCEARWHYYATFIDPSGRYSAIDFLIRSSCNAPGSCHCAASWYADWQYRGRPLRTPLSNHAISLRRVRVKTPGVTLFSISFLFSWTFRFTQTRACTR